jgi:hypothetical protein
MLNNIYRMLKVGSVQEWQLRSVDKIYNTLAPLNSKPHTFHKTLIDNLLNPNNPKK